MFYFSRTNTEQEPGTRRFGRMAVEDAEFGSQKLPTTLSVGALQAARSLNLPCGGSFSPRA